MNVVIYNQNCIDSIFSAAFLQTMGWKAFSSREVVDVEFGKYVWISVLPTKHHFRHPDRENNRHICLLKHCRTKKIDHLLIKGVVYGEDSLGEETTVTVDNVVTGTSKRTLLDQITSIEGINSPECRYLSYLISGFYQPKTSADVLALTVLNVMKALECLKTGEPFTPVPLVFTNGVSEDLVKAHVLLKDLRKKTGRILEIGALYNYINTNQGSCRVVRTYEADLWWFLRRSFQPGDSAFNITISATGAMVDATTNFSYDLGLSDPIVIVS